MGYKGLSTLLTWDIVSLTKSCQRQENLETDDDQNIWSLKVNENNQIYVIFFQIIHHSIICLTIYHWKKIRFKNDVARIFSSKDDSFRSGTHKDSRNRFPSSINWPWNIIFSTSLSNQRKTLKEIDILPPQNMKLTRKECFTFI